MALTTPEEHPDGSKTWTAVLQAAFQVGHSTSANSFSSSYMAPLPIVLMTRGPVHAFCLILISCFRCPLTDASRGLGFTTVRGVSSRICRGTGT